MASLLTRILASFQSNIPNPTLNDLDSEFNQYVGAAGVFNGGTTGKKLLTKTSDAVDPVYEFDQVGAGPIIECKQNGGLKVSVNNAGQIVSGISTGTAPIDVTSTTMCPHLNADQVDGIEGANIAQIGVSKIPFSLAFRVEDPSTYALNDDTVTLFVRVPAVNTAFITKLVIIRTGGTHTAGGSVTFKARIFNSSTVGSGVAFSDTNNLANTPYTDDFVDTAVVEGNYIGFVISARSGTISETKVNVTLEGYQTIKA